MRTRGYIYPFSSRDGGMKNPYISHFIDALKEKIDFVNQDSPSNTGLFDVLKYIRNLDIFFLNWPEEMLEKKGGIIQFFLFIVLIRWLKFKKVKIFWTFHNKESHNKNKIRLKNYIRNFTIRNADYIITHARDGVSSLENLPKPVKAKIRFFHHPVLPPVKLEMSGTKLYDLLIWGMVTPYKGIDQFLDYLIKEKIDSLKVLVAGKISDNAYRDKIRSYRCNQFEIRDEFISVQQLEGFISGSKAVLFTYLEYSILSSGALMDTLRYAPVIIGPNFGAFKDLHDEGLILTYNDYPHLISLLNNLDQIPDTEKINRFLADNSWKNFSNSVYNFIISE